MKKLIIILFLLPFVSIAQFKSDKEAKKYFPVVFDSTKKNTKVKYHFTIDGMIEKKTGKTVSISFILWKDGHWTEKIIK